VRRAGRKGGLTVATFSTTYNPDQHGPSGPERGPEDYNLLEESCEHGRHTLAGIIERADALSGSGGSLESFRAEVQRLTEDALAASEVGD